jgi:hypothetical protein
VTLRCTVKLLSLLRARVATLPETPAKAEDWYANLLWIDRRKCLLLSHAATFFPIFVPEVLKADLVPVGHRITAIIEDHLLSEQLPADSFGVLDPNDVSLAKTSDRSTLGVMNQIARDIRYQVASMGGLERTEPAYVNHFIRRTLHGTNREYMTPLERAGRWRG